MIEAVQGHGVPRVRVLCDDCGRDEVVTCDYERRGTEWAPNEGQALRKMEGRKWARVKGKLRCPSCEAKRKAIAPRLITDNTDQEDATMAVATQKQELRRPTAAQKRQIIGLLEDAYDDDAKRYRNPTDNDKAIADTVGDGCLWGWVAEIREELFGPDTRNAEIEAVRNELKRVEGQVGNLIGEARKLEDEIANIRARLGKVV